MRSPACFPGMRAYRPDAPLFAVNPMFALEREAREPVAEGIGHLCLAWVSLLPQLLRSGYSCLMGMS